MEIYTPANAGVFLYLFLYYKEFIMFEKFSHEVTSPYLWLFIMLLALRAEYSCLKRKDYVHAAAFLFVIIIAAYFSAVRYGLLQQFSL